MKNIITVFLSAVAVVALMGCANHPHHNGPYGGHTERWYATHKKQMAAEAKWCDAGSTHRENTKSCDAAYAGIQAALQKDMWGNGKVKPPTIGAGPLSNMQPIN